MSACGILLSGGKSSRMGTNKALLKINEQPNIARIKAELQSVVTDMILVTNEPQVYQFLNLPIATDEYPGQGPLAGIHAGLKASPCDLNVVVACDMPFVSATLAESMLDSVSNYDAVIPVLNGKQQPLFAVYRKGIFEKIEKCIEEKKLRIQHLLDEIDVLYLSGDKLQSCMEENLDRVFFNMNDPEDYEQAKKWAELGE
jgi:molybdopterin-guanine dinucleotide biosynthesis protein A